MKSIDEAISQIETLQKVLKKHNSNQVRDLDTKSAIKATAMSWFQNIRSQTNLTDEQLHDVDEDYKFLLMASDKSTTKLKYLSRFKIIRSNLITLRSDNIISIANQKNAPTDNPPNFSTLIKDDKMKQILLKRWDECIKCIEINAPLSALVMMGGMLEAILLAKINSFNDKPKIFKAKSAPIDKKTSKVFPLQEWTLRNYIDVSHELTWISQSTKDVGEVLRDYRNYIHPYKELSHGIVISKQDAMLFWQITKSIINQLL